MYFKELFVVKTNNEGKIKKCLLKNNQINITMWAHEKQKHQMKLKLKNDLVFRSNTRESAVRCF